MARSLANFYVDVLQELGVAGPDRAVSAEDLQVVTDLYPAVWQLLEAEGLTNWLQSGSIPDKAVIPMRWIVAYHCAVSFGLRGDRLMQLQERGQIGGPAPSLGEKMLAKQRAAEYIPSILANDYY